MTPLRQSGIWPWLAVTGCFGGAFVLACLLTASAPAPDNTAGGIAGLLFGGSRRALSADMFDQADTFFHRGSAHRERRVEMNDWFQRVHADIQPEAHRHAEGADSVEIIPWLRLATETDPHNVEAWLVAAYWLETGLGRTDLAEQVLREGQRVNRGDYRLLLDRARLCVRTGRFEAAANLLDAAMKCWPGPLDPADLQSRLDKAEIFTYRALLHEMNGQRPEALAAFKNVLALFPERTYINETVRTMESGAELPVSARRLLENVVKRSMRHACDEDTDHETKEHKDQAARSPTGPSG